MTTQAQPGKFDRRTGVFSAAQVVNWGLYRHINVNNPWPGPGSAIYEISADYSYQLDGDGTDIIVVDTGIDAYHPEFIEDSNSSICVESGNAMTETSLNTTNSLRGVVRYAGAVVSVGDRGEIRYNTQQIQTGKNYSLLDLTVFQNKLYAVGGFYGATTNTYQTPQGPGIKVLISDTGQIWSDITPHGVNNNLAQCQLRSAAASATSLVAVGTPQFTERRFDLPQQKYIAPTAKILRYDGAVWSEITTNFVPPLNYNLNRVRYFRDRYIAVGDNGTILVSGDDGLSWTRMTSTVTCGLQDITSIAPVTITKSFQTISNLFVAVGRGGCIVTSNDNITWTQRNSGTTADLFAVTYNQGKFIALGQNGAAVYSTDGINWNNYITGISNTVYAARGADMATGAGTRVQAYDWRQLALTYGDTTIPSSVSIGGYLGDATAADPTVSGGGHGSNVASIAAGRSNGWAKRAKIYSLRIFSGIDMTTGSTLGNISQTKYAQLIKAFHTAKSAPRRPTIVNLSLQTVLTQTSGRQYISSITYRGVTTNNSTTTAYRDTAKGLVSQTFPIRNTSVDADLDSAMGNGVIIVGAAGNFSYKQDIPTGLDYNNQVNLLNLAGIPPTQYYMRGSSPAAAGNVSIGNAVICVGALDSSFFDPTRNVREQKASYSHTGPRVDIYAAGSDIMGAYRNVRYSANYPIIDDRSVGTDYCYYLNKISGTSQACPQVTGICSLLAQQNTTLTQATMREAVLNPAQINKLTVTNSNFQNNSTLPAYENFSSLLSGSNILAYVPAINIAAGTMDFFNGVAGSGQFDLE